MNVKVRHYVAQEQDLSERSVQKKHESPRLRDSQSSGQVQVIHCLGRRIKRAVTVTITARDLQ